MKINIISVCVNYSDYLSFTYEYNKEEFVKHNYWIITHSKDTATINFCKQHNISYYTTNAFYQYGSIFNKAASMNNFCQEKYVDILQDNSWTLFCDSDTIVAPVVKEFCEIIGHKKTECLYCANRWVCDNMDNFMNKKCKFEAHDCLGYFQLFSTDIIKNSYEKGEKLLQDSGTCAVYDEVFARQFNCRMRLSIPVMHIGPTHINWHGRKSCHWSASQIDKL